MSSRSVKKYWKATLGFITLAFFQPFTFAADVPETYQVVEGIAIYLGVMPAQIVKGHPKKHPEAKMHGGVPILNGDGHVVVALFDNATRQRIENAKVTGRVMGIGLSSQWKPLKSMTIANTITYGNYFNMASKNDYHINLQIRRPGIQGVIEATFTHRHAGATE